MKSSCLLYLYCLHFLARKGSKRMTHFNLEKNVAIQGYDPVAYFKQGKPLKGKIAATYEAWFIIFRCQVIKNIS
jgi:hypothetical protein